MNDRHLSGVSTPADSPTDSSYDPYGSSYDQSSYGYQGSQDTSYGYVTGTFDTLGAAYGDGDPLFGPLPGDTPAAPAAPRHEPGTAPDGTWGSDTGRNPVYDGYPTASWGHIPAQATGSPDETGQGWADTGHGPDAYAGWPGAAPDGTWGSDTGRNPVYDGYPTASWDDTGAYTTTEPGAPDTYGTSAAYAAYAPADTDGHEPSPEHHGAPEAFGPAEAPGGPDTPDAQDGPDDPDSLNHQDDLGHPEESGRPGPSPVRSGGSRRRRSVRPKRSALLTVAVPSVCVMGVTAVAAASVSGVGDESDDTTTQAAADSSAVKSTAANRKLDTQLAGLSDEAVNFADRASRTQERIDLKERQEAERKRKEAEAARKEAMRPKFALPVVQQGLSAYYGQAGINWVSLHTGLDFPVSYGTPVMAATDGTVRTQTHPAYGVMAIVTAPDGTETWYCHLSSTRIRSGYVKAGDTIAYSGNSGKSTGPHLHFEVRPGGGPAVDPLPWFRSKGLDPT